MTILFVITKDDNSDGVTVCCLSNRMQEILLHKKPTMASGYDSQQKMTSQQFFDINNNLYVK